MTWRCYNMYLTGDSSPPLVLFFLFFPCSSVGKSTTRTQHRLSLGVELVGAIIVLGVYESERCGAADTASGSGPLPHPTTTLAICAVTVLSFIQPINQWSIVTNPALHCVRLLSKWDQPEVCELSLRRNTITKTCGILRKDHIIAPIRSCLAMPYERSS